MKHIITIFSTLLLFSLFSCRSEVKQDQEVPISSYQPEYAHFFRIDYFEDYKKILIINPWGNEALNMDYYILQDTAVKINYQNPNSFQISSIPKKVVALSSPIVGLMNLLELSHHIKGVTDPELIYNEEIKKRIENVEIENIGKSIQVNMEKLILIQPDLILGSGWDKLNADYQKMMQLNMKPVMMYDWQELHPLGKAEWMILLASFFNEEEKAISTFREIRDKYNEQKEGLSFDKHPVVFNGSDYQGIWYSAGGQSYMAQLYNDASAKYLMHQDSSTGSLMLDFEVLMQKASKADIWMYTGASNKESLDLFYSPKYQSLSAVKNRRVYSYHKRLNEYGANDYWETASFRPDIVLEDFIKIFHDSKPKGMYYFDKVEY